MKQAADKSHHTLHKFMHKYEVTVLLNAASLNLCEEFLAWEFKCIVEFVLLLSEISSCFKERCERSC